MSALAFACVSKSFGARRVLDGVTCAISEGERVAIIGRSGSGKSTLLHIAAGIETPTSGSVHLFGRELGALDERARTLVRRDSIGLVFQFFHLLPHLTVLENVALPAMIAGDRDDKRAMQLLEQVGLADRATDSAQKLSGGEMQRVAICRALLRKPRLILADEPTGNLDDATGRAVMQTLFDATQGSTLVVVTHSTELAGLADRQLTLTSGVLT